MTINRYRANSLKAAIDKARAELGPEAKIIHVRQLDAYAATGTRSSDPNDEKIEIVAAIDDKKDGDIPIKPASDEENDTQEAQHLKSDAQRLEKAIASQRANNQGNTQQIESNGNFQRAKPAKSAYEQAFLRSLGEQIPDEAMRQIGSPSKQPVLEISGLQGSSQGTQYRRNMQHDSSAETVSKPADNGKNKDKILQVLQKCCSKNQINPDIAYNILSLLNNGHNNGDSSLATPKDYISHFINEQVNVSGGLDKSRKTAIFIGPTGVGKTTTLAKLAAQYHFQHKKNVGLITIDAYRIAAINQLKTYAQIMSIPLKVALTPAELAQSINDYDDMDIILVDTPGRSQFNTDAIGALEDFLEVAQPADTHLLITVSTKENDAYTVIDNFAPDYVRQLLFTKLDETSTFGSILNICTKVKKPISYLTTGQNVPDDIEVAKVDQMADIFLNAKYSALGS